MDNMMQWNLGNGKIRQRASDGYLNANDICTADGKQWHDYWRTQAAQEFARELSLSTGIPVDTLVDAKSGRYGGTWIHPKIAIDLARWCSAKRALVVVDIIEWFIRGDLSMATDILERQKDENKIEWIRTRIEAKQSNIKRNKIIEAHDGHSWIYGHCSDSINLNVTSLKAKDIQDGAGVEHTRDALSPLQLALIRAAELAQIEAIEKNHAKGNQQIKKVTDRSDAVIGRAAKDLGTRDTRLIYDRTNPTTRRLKENRK